MTEVASSWAHTAPYVFDQSTPFTAIGAHTGENDTEQLVPKHFMALPKVTSIQGL